VRGRVEDQRRGGKAHSKGKNPLYGELIEPFYGEHVEPRFILGERPAWDRLGFFGEKNFFKIISFLKICRSTIPEELEGWLTI
jgi:hypothetical protein